MERPAARPCGTDCNAHSINYPLNDEKFKQIRDETEARKQAAIEAHDEERQDLVVAQAV